MLLLVSSICIVGFYNVTRHFTVTQPNGEITIEGDILKFHSIFWEHIKRVDKLYYSGESLEYKFFELQRLYPNIFNKLQLSENNKSLSAKPTTILTAEDIFQIELILRVIVEFKEPDIYFLYTEEPIYYFPEWVRNPISQCPKCMSSFFGSIIWIGVNYLNHNLFNWTNHEYLGFFFFWFIFVISLSYINNYIHKNIGT